MFYTLLAVPSSGQIFENASSSSSTETGKTQLTILHVACLTYYFQDPPLQSKQAFNEDGSQKKT